MFVLLFFGCQQEELPQQKLDFGLETHFSLISQGQTGSARVRLRQLMEERGVSSQNLFLMGLSYHHEAQYVQAAEWFEKATQFPQAQSYAPAWHFLGWSLFYTGQLEASRQAFEHFLEYQPDEPDSLFALGLISTEEGNLNSATQYFNASIEASEQHVFIRAKAKARLADVLATLDQWSEAILLYQEATALHPDLYESWYRLSQALRRTRRDEDATIAYKQFIEAKNRVRPDLQAQTRFPE